MKLSAELRRMQRRADARGQRGVTLIVTLVMLVLITLVGVSSIRNSTLDERMAGNSRDRDKAFQAAEAAVQTCLSRIQAETYTGTPLVPAASNATPVWEVAANWSNANSVEIDLGAAARLAAQPRCIYETLGTGSYRVTGRAVGASDLTVVMLQATYSTE
jgi:type IV pilus assembly protein PilX